MTDTGPDPKVAPRGQDEAGIGIPDSAIHCRCGAWWTGLTAGHCTGCHRTFSGIAAFDRHRTGSHAGGTRRCLDPATVVNERGEPQLVPANRLWSGWALPGTWEGPDS